MFIACEDLGTEHSGKPVLVVSVECIHVCCGVARMGYSSRFSLAVVGLSIRLSAGKFELPGWLLQSVMDVQERDNHKILVEWRWLYKTSEHYFVRGQRQLPELKRTISLYIQ